MKVNLIALLLAYLLAGTAQSFGAKTEARSVVTRTPVLDITSAHDFRDQSVLDDSPAGQLPGLCSLAQFSALPSVDRHVYSFATWPSENDDLGAKSYAFNFRFGQAGTRSQKVTFIPDGSGPGGVFDLTRSFDEKSNRSYLAGFGNLSWSGKSTQTFRFDKPVLAFGVVVESSGDFEIRKFFWDNATDLNGYPISYTLSDGTVVQLGQRDLRGALVKGGHEAFIGIIDRSGHGIVSVTYTLAGVAGNVSQDISIRDIVFASLPKPDVADVINLKSSTDFADASDIARTPVAGIADLLSLDAFRFIVGNHRYVYDFETLPRGLPAKPAGSASFAFDLKGKGAMSERVSLTARNANGAVRLTPTTLKSAESLPYNALELANIGKDDGSSQTFRFEKPVDAFGVVYSSPADVTLGISSGTPISYTLSDGSIVRLGKPGITGGTIPANNKTFVGISDKSGKGITSITLHLQTGSNGQPLYVEDLALAMPGPPPGNWKLTFDDEFDGTRLNPDHWASGFTFPDVINSELQAYVPENVVVSGGVCTIKTEVKESVNTDRTGRTGEAQHFASGAFTSFGKFTQTYGYFEARIKMPRAPGAGIWPAFWMLPDRGKAYPDTVRTAYRTRDAGMGSETDIFEFQPSWRKLDGTFPIHCGTIWSYGKETADDPAPHGYGSFGLDNDGWGPEEMSYRNADTEFHTYGLYWSPQRLIFFVDSKPIYRVRDPKNIPNVPEYFLFNVAVTGNSWGKTPDKSNPTLEQIRADMPNEMEIDYFRAYSGTLDDEQPGTQRNPAVPINSGPPAESSAPTTAPSASAPPRDENAPAAPVNSTISTPSQ